MSPLLCFPNAAARTAAGLAHLLAVPPPTPLERRWQVQSLAKGAAGIALIHVERAHAGVGGWGTAHAWLIAATQGDISAGSDAGLYFGAPALAFAVHAADADNSGRYPRALAALDASVVALTHRRVDRACARIDSGELPGPAEFDVISGLSGIGAHLLAHVPGSDALERVLSYLVRLTEPLRIDSEVLPGWWTGHDPHLTTSPGYRGHGNFGMAHGIAGPLALLALAMRHDVVVNGHLDAIEGICAWLDVWRQDRDGGAWWPQWITHDEQRTGRIGQPGPLRPSWCYGTPGLARAQQLAGIAIGDARRRLMAEDALVACLSDPSQLGLIVDTSLCHGWAGLFQTVWRIAAESSTPMLAGRLLETADLLLRHARPGAGEGTGLLEGDAGLALALHTAAQGDGPISGWDRCLLIA